jgi:sn-glycerol 3-phosphate transport system ATP-binding protein
MSDIVIESVSRLWGQARALDQVSFRVESGKFAVLLGPSGCGKSTLLRIIAGLDQPNEGHIHIAGKDVTGLAPAQRGISMVFQSYALFPHLTVAQNICFGLEVRKVAPAERALRLEKASELLGLSALLQRKPSQLSGGQQQRVALGRAIVAQAPVCLMDEPLSNLDAQLRQEMRLEIRELQRRLKITMLYVTHDQVEAMTMADTLYSRPATTFAARFLGTPPMNVVALEAGGRVAGRPIASAGEGFAVGVRPEDIRLSGEGVPARIESIEYLGADTLVAGRAGGETIVARLPGRVNNAIGDTVFMIWDADRQHLFDLSDGNRLDGAAGRQHVR